MNRTKKTGFLCLTLICIFLSYSVIAARVTGAVSIGERTKMPETLIPGGNVIGVKLYTEGVHVVGITFVDTEKGKVYPARQAGIKEGDFIVEINGEKVENNEDFAIKLQKDGESKIKINRNGKLMDAVITPVISKDDGAMRIGMWVRDSTAGIGTVTFYNPENNSFGALGHGIADQDTGKILNIKNGDIYPAYLTSVRKGEKGKPGELNGLIANRENKAGELFKNSEKGIFGEYAPEKLKLNNEPIPVGNREQVKEGKATIRASVGQDEVEEYDIEIVKINKGTYHSTKGMVIKITDPDLLQNTNGIVQGMSGSPIIQNGRIVGAVTHVFVNDPTRGYGIFIENMLSEAAKIK